MMFLYSFLKMNGPSPPSGRFITQWPTLWIFFSFDFWIFSWTKLKKGCTGFWGNAEEVWIDLFVGFKELLFFDMMSQNTKKKSKIQWENPDKLSINLRSVKTMNEEWLVVIKTIQIDTEVKFLIVQLSIRYLLD